MAGLLILLAALAAPQPASPATPAPALRPTATATAHATARIRVIAGVKFGEAYSLAPSGGQRRAAQVADYGGRLWRAELLEFQ